MSKRDASGLTINNNGVNNAIVETNVNTNNGDQSIAGPSEASSVSVNVSVNNKSPMLQQLGFDPKVLCEGIQIENINIVI